MRRLLTGLLLLLLTLGATPARAQTPEDPDYTPEQTNAMRAIRDKYEAKRHDLYLRIYAKKGELMDLLSQDDPDKAAIKTKMDEKMSLESERQRLMLDEIFEVKAVLRPVQWRHYIRKVVVYMTGGGHR